MVYLVGNWEMKTIKIGFSDTKESCYSRLSALQTGNCCELELISIMYGDFDYETEIHEMLRAYHKRGEWFFLNKGSIQLLENYFPVNLNMWLNDERKIDMLQESQHYSQAFYFLCNIYPNKSSSEIRQMMKENDRYGNKTYRKGKAMSAVSESFSKR